MRISTPVLAASAAVVLGWSSVAAAVPASAAPPKCADLNGSVDASQMCQIQEADPAYTLHIAYPVDYPDVTTGLRLHQADPRRLHQRGEDA